MSNETTTSEGFSSGLQTDLTQQFGEDAKDAIVGTDAVTGKSTLFSKDGSTLGEIDTDDGTRAEGFLGKSDSESDQGIV